MIATLTTGAFLVVALAGCHEKATSEGPWIGIGEHRPGNFTDQQRLLEDQLGPASANITLPPSAECGYDLSSRMVGWVDAKLADVDPVTVWLLESPSEVRICVYDPTLDELETWTRLKSVQFIFRLPYVEGSSGRVVPVDGEPEEGQS